MGEKGVRSYRPSFLMLVVLGIHVAGVGSFMMMSGCATKKPASVEPPPAPILAPGAQQPVAPSETVMPRPVIRPPVAVERVPDSIDSAGASTYTVQKGDSLSKIAAKAGVSVREIAELNKLADQNQIRIGQRLLLPSHAKSISQAPVADKPQERPAPRTTTSPAAPAKASGNTHVVASGDTLGKLAVRYSTTVAAFKEVNNLKSDTIRIGQKLAIPASGSSASTSARTSAPATATPAPAVSAPAPAPAAAIPVPAPVVAPAVVDSAVADDSDSSSEVPFPYIVKEGDTLDSIALRFSVRKDVIMRLNDLTSESVRAGQRLLIPWN